MLSSQFILESRLAELRPSSRQMRLAEAARGVVRPAHSFAATIRLLIAGAPSASRPAGLAAR